MSYRVTFPNDYEPMTIPSLDGFKMDKEFNDVVFGWFGSLYISVVKEDYKKFMESENEI